MTATYNRFKKKTTIKIERCQVSLQLHIHICLKYETWAVKPQIIKIPEV